MLEYVLVLETRDQGVPQSFSIDNPVEFSLFFNPSDIYIYIFFSFKSTVKSISVTKWAGRVSSEYSALILVLYRLHGCSNK